MLTLRADEQSVLTAVYKDAADNDAFIDGAPVWTVSDATILLLVDTEDDNIKIVRATGLPGTAQVAVTADADLTEGVANIIGLLDVTVLPGEAVTVNIGTGTVETIPAEPVVDPIDPVVDPIDPVVDPAV